jgi:DNA-binding IscR family transcriptional regulator
VKISYSAYLGVELLVRLAARNADPPCTTETLARSIRRSVSYTEQLIAQLARLASSKRNTGPGRWTGSPWLTYFPSSTSRAP